MEKQTNSTSDRSRSVPKLRFPEFNGEWENRKLGEVLEFKNGINAAKEQLRETQARAYKDHPNKGLRKYWGAGNGS